jgi:hypothetical protein
MQLPILVEVKACEGIKIPEPAEGGEKSTKLWLHQLQQQVLQRAADLSGAGRNGSICVAF